MKPSKPFIALLFGAVGLWSANAGPATPTSNTASCPSAVTTPIPDPYSIEMPRQERVIRTFWDALGRDFLGQRGRDIFDVGGSIRAGSPRPAPVVSPKAPTAAAPASKPAQPPRNP